MQMPANRYALSIHSNHMTTQVTNRQFDGKLRDSTEVKQEYTATLKKEVFLKFFNVLKMPG